MLNAAIKRFKTGLHRSGLVSESVETLEYAGASAALGYLHVKYRDQSKLLGMELPLAVGVLGTAAQLGMAMFMPGHGKIAHHLGVATRAGFGSWAHGLGAGLASSGQKRLLLPPGADVGAAQRAIPGSTVLGGGLPGAPTGDLLTRDRLRALARS